MQNTQILTLQLFKTLRLRQSGQHFADDIFKCISLNKDIWIWIDVSLKFVLTGPINNIPAFVQMMAWRQPGNKPLSEPMMVCLLMHKCVTWPQFFFKGRKSLHTFHSIWWQWHDKDPVKIWLHTAVKIASINRHGICNDLFCLEY